MVHIYNGILLSHKNEWNNAICSNMDGPRDSKSDKDKYYMTSLMWNLKTWYKWTYLQTRNILIDIENSTEVPQKTKNRIII